MAKHTDSPEDAPVDTSSDVIPPYPGDYVPLSRARAALQKLLDTPEFRKTPAAVDVAYALGALEEDVDGGVADAVRAREHKEENLARTIELAHLLVELVPKWFQSFGLFRDMGPVVAATPDVAPRQCIANPSNLSVWVCCQCRGKAPGAPVTMITDRNTCPVCQHARCDDAPVVA